MLMRYVGQIVIWYFSFPVKNTNTTIPAVNIRENDALFMIEVAAPGLAKENFKVNLDRNRLVTIPKREEVKPKPAREIDIL